MKHVIIYLFVASIFLSYCNRKSSEKNRVELFKAAFDSTISLEPEMNTANFFVDFGGIKNIQEFEKKQFLLSRPNVKECNFDTLMKTDTNWRKHAFFTETVIGFESYNESSDTTKIITSKSKSLTSYIESEIQFIKKNSAYEHVNTKTIWKASKGDSTIN